MLIVEVMDNFESLECNLRSEEEGTVGQLIEISIEGKIEEDYKNNKLCIQCGYDTDFGDEMYEVDEIKDGLCVYCREALEKIKETKFECSHCGEEFYGTPIEGGKEIPATWENPSEFIEDGTIFCSDNCFENYYENEGYDY